VFYFLHISKCAGSSFVELARRNVPLFRPNANGNPLNPLTGERIRFWHWSLAEQHHFLSSPRWQFVANELQIGSEAPFLEGVTYVTILREPIERLFSAFQFSIGKPDKSLPLEERGEDFAQFLKNKGTQWRRNHLVAALTYRSKRLVEERLELAKQRLAQFDHVLLMDDLGAQIGAFAQYGWSNLEFPWKNAGSRGEANWSAARRALAKYPELLGPLLEENAADLDLYAFAHQLVERRKSEPPNLERVPRLAVRAMPESANFEFLVTCAYEAFLSGDHGRAGDILAAAGKLPEAGQFDHGLESFAKVALLRFKDPLRAYRQVRRKKQQSKLQATAA